ncbi:MAG: phosphoadenosine phosphosulfate reductase family protein, partial [Bacteroidota bacterium]|nr:phosphoadenosine phosphosulfate reductase family protein [Bacteroidota bacterium]
MDDQNIVSVLNKQADAANLVEMLENVAKQFSGKAVFTTSLGIEDQVITDMIFSNNLDIKVVTLDTGRLFEETYKVFNRTIEKYGKTIHVYFPKNDSVEKMVTEKGTLSFYLSVENRKECCNIRKVEPLGRALAGMECWITGLRASQSENRHDLD